MEQITREYIWTHKYISIAVRFMATEIPPAVDKNQPIVVSPRPRLTSFQMSWIHLANEGPQKGHVAWLSSFSLWKLPPTEAEKSTYLIVIVG